jgi:uncharacterized protein YlxW (UPF0749 family)
MSGIQIVLGLLAALGYAAALVMVVRRSADAADVARLQRRATSAEAEADNLRKRVDFLEPKVRALETERDYLQSMAQGRDDIKELKGLVTNVVGRLDQLHLDLMGGQHG